MKDANYRYTLTASGDSLANRSSNGSNKEYIYWTRSPPISLTRAVPWNYIEFHGTCSAPISLLLFYQGIYGERVIIEESVINKMEIIFTWHMYTTLDQEVNDTEHTDLKTPNLVNHRNDPLYKNNGIIFDFIRHALSISLMMGKCNRTTIHM